MRERDLAALSHAKGVSIVRLMRPRRRGLRIAWIASSVGLCLALAAGGAVLLAQSTTAYQRSVQHRQQKDQHISDVLAQQQKEASALPKAANVAPGPVPQPAFVVEKLNPRQSQMGWLVQQPNVVSFWSVGVVPEYHAEAWNPEYAYSGYVANDSSQGFIAVWVANDASSHLNGKWTTPESGTVAIASVQGSTISWRGSAGESGTFDLITHRWAVTRP